VFSVPIIFDFNKNVVASLVMRKIRESPITGGTATFAETVNYPLLEKDTIKMLTRLGWRGIATAEFKLDPRDNVPKLMEVNPRFFGYTNLAILAGIDLPYILYKVAKNETINKKVSYDKLSFSRLMHDLYIFIMEMGENYYDLSEVIIEFISSYKNNKVIFDYLLLNDILPFFSSLLSMLGKEFGFIRKPYAPLKKKW
jgi:predicted ATP-grasp superfamily ATP-dependent carboligase